MPTQLQLAKDFIELSIILNPDRQFLLPAYTKGNNSHILLYKAIQELKKDGRIRINLSIKGEIFITLKS